MRRVFLIKGFVGIVLVFAFSSGTLSGIDRPQGNTGLVAIRNTGGRVSILHTAVRIADPQAGQVSPGEVTTIFVVEIPNSAPDEVRLTFVPALSGELFGSEIRLNRYQSRSPRGQTLTELHWRKIYDGETSSHYEVEVIRREPPYLVNEFSIRSGEDTASVSIGPFWEHKVASVRRPSAIKPDSLMTEPFAGSVLFYDTKGLGFDNRLYVPIVVTDDILLSDPTFEFKPTEGGFNAKLLENRRKNGFHVIAVEIPTKLVLNDFHMPHGNLNAMVNGAHQTFAVFAPFTPCSDWVKRLARER